MAAILSRPQFVDTVATITVTINILTIFKVLTTHMKIGYKQLKFDDTRLSNL